MFMCIWFLVVVWFVLLGVGNVWLNVIKDVLFISVFGLFMDLLKVS